MNLERFFKNKLLRVLSKVLAYVYLNLLP
jgi:hypothetical protein